MGRKSKLTPELQAKIVQAILGGNYDYIAAQHAGIGETTFYRWLTEGEKPQSGVKREFWVAVKNASAQAEVRNVALIETAATKNWQAAAWLLERQHNGRWGRKERQEHVGEGGGPVVVTMADLVKKAAEEDSEG